MQNKVNIILRRVANRAFGLTVRPQNLGFVASGVRTFADDASLKKTVLYDFHVKHGGKMVPFAGWSMPIQYKDSIMESTQFCRSDSSLFDVSHMCGLSLRGKDAIKFIEGLVVGDIAGLKDGTGTLTLFTNEQGGIIDDSIVTKVTSEHLYVVINAGCRDKDLAHINKHLSEKRAAGYDVSIELHDDRSLLALQGPAASEVLGSILDADKKSVLETFYFGQMRTLSLAGSECWVTRTGYTGEDGFEISVPHAHTLALAEALVSNPRVRLAGLGPRDSLRLEAGLCLYGNDIDETTSPVEAGLLWTVGKRRRELFDFLGGDKVKAAIAEGASKKRVGLVVLSGAPARQHSKLLSEDGKVEIGEVTSGGYSPCLKKNIAMGYVPKALEKAGTKLKVNVRGKISDVEVAKMPFVPSGYYRPPAPKK